VPWLFLVLPSVAAVTLLNGRFETTSDVQYLLDLALDAAAMREATTMAEKASIYQNVSISLSLLISADPHHHSLTVNYREQSMEMVIFRT